MALEHVSPGDPHAVSHNEERDAINHLNGEVGKPNRSSLRGFFPTHKALASGDATIVAMGDSKTEGTGLKTTTERWLYKLQENLRAQYGETDKGYGYIPAKYGTFYDFDDKPTTVGTVTGTTQGWGLGTRSLKMDAGASVTFPILPYTANTPLVVHWTRKSGGGEFEVVVGGVVHATIATAGGAMSMQTEVALPAGDHAVQLRTKGSVAVSIEGIFNRTAVEGVRVIDGSLSGGTFKNFGQDLVGNGHWSAAAHYGIDGVVMAFGANDMSGRTPAEMVTDAESAIAKAKVAAPNAGIVILMGTERTQDAGTGKVREYEAAMRSAFAEESNISVLYESDLWVPTAGVDYTWGGPDGWLVDTVHTSANAHTEIAAYLAKFMSPPTPKVPTTPGEVGALPADYIPPNQTWEQITNKPGTYPPSTHTHTWGSVTGKPSTFTPSAHAHTWDSVTGKPSAFSPSAHASRHASGGSDAITPASIGAASVNYSTGPDELFSNPFLRDHLGGWAGGGWSWDESGRGILFLGTGGYGEKIACEPGTTVTMHAFVMPHPTAAASPAKLAMQKTTPGSGTFSYDGDYLRETQWVSVPAQGASLTATFTVDTDGFRPRMQGGSGRLVYLSIAVGDVAPSLFHASETLRGTGSPEVVVTAPPRTEYTDTAGTNGAWKWTKESGTDSTGWIVTEGNTGLRNVTALAVITPTAGRILLQRVNDQVDLIFESLILPAGTGNITLFHSTNPIPDGFKKRVQNYRVDSWMGSRSTSQVPAWMTWFGYNTVQWLGTGMTPGGTRPTHAIDGAFSVRTVDAWPTTLPGTPA